MLSIINPVSSGLAETLVIGLVWGGVFGTILLISVLSFKEVVSASKYYTKILEFVTNSVIYPLLMVFAFIVAFKTLEVIYT